MAREIIPGIYKITNTVNGKIYIGQSKNILHRFRRHYWSAIAPGDGNYTITPLVAAFREYGINNFAFEIIDSGPKFKSPDVRAQMEQYWIMMYHSNNPSVGYNCDGGGGLGVLSPRVQSFRERLKRAEPAFLYTIETQSVLLYHFGAKAIADDFGTIKDITSHALNRGDIYNKDYYIIPAKRDVRYRIVGKKVAKLDAMKNDPSTRPRSYHRYENNYQRYMVAVRYIDSIAHEFGFY